MAQIDIIIIIYKNDERKYMCELVWLSNHPKVFLGLFSKWLHCKILQAGEWFCFVIFISFLFIYSQQCNQSNLIRIKLLKTEGRWLWIIFLLCIKGRLMDDRSSFLHKTIITRNEGSFNEIDTPHQLMGCVVNQTINLEKCTSLF